ncbi:MAG: glutathione-disulfide reductase [Porticoccaceae bacterium]
MSTSEYDYDLFVIGAGSGGVRAARMSAQYGAKVAIAEERYLGGTCVNVGCVPKKLFVYAAEVSRNLRDAAGFGWQIGDSEFDWPTLRDNKTREIERLNGVYRDLLVNAGVELIDGRATIAGPNKVRVNGREHSARHILIAVGGWPRIPDIPGRELAISSNEAFYLETLPKRVIVVGGGYIAVEFAGIFQGFGCDTHVAYRGKTLLKNFDADLSKSLTEQMSAAGIQLHFDADICAIEKQSDGSLRAHFVKGGHLDADAVMFATGRVPLTEGLGLKNTAVTRNDKGAIEVDDHFQSREPSIYAIGDVIDRLQLTPVAISEAMVLADNLFRGGTGAMDYRNIPTAVFSQPPIGTVGLSEAEARKQFADDVVIYRTDFRPMKQTLGGGPERVLMKLVVQNSTDRVLGCHMLGEGAGEIMQGFAVAIKAGATKADFDATVGIHPTAAEEFVTMRTPVQEE